jgi:murein DD-endopeptidase MepM/ murein hydrolase activator NlpD
MPLSWLTARRVQFGSLLLATAVALWLVGSRAPQPVIVSAWRGEGGAAPQVAPAAAAEPHSAGHATAPAAVGALVTDVPPQDRPWGSPLGSMPVVLTQGYGVGTHAPAARKGGIDLAADGDGDGRSDPSISLGLPLYATMSGVVEARANTYPAGNHLWIKNAHYKVGYAHLRGFAVRSGQTVRRGELIGYMGASGHATGPHLHYHIWKDGVNVNPLDYGALP